MVTLRHGRSLLATASLVLAAGLGLTAVPSASAPSAPRALAGTTASQAVTTGFAPRPASLLTAPAPYAFASMLDGRPVRWDPCTPIRWTAATARGPVGGLDVLKTAVARVAAATGTTWQYVGATPRVPTSDYLPRTSAGSYPPVLIGWTDGAASDLLRGQARSVLGMTRTAWFGVQRPDGTRVAATRAAVVALDRTDPLPLRGATSWTTVALHELGHSMGLAHVGDTRQLMANVLPRAATDLQAGDRAGLVRLGRTAGCIRVPAL